MNGWPSDKSVFEHAAYELLKWASDHKDEYRGMQGRNQDRRTDLIFASRDGVPEIGEYNRIQNELEKHKIGLDGDIRDIVGIQKIQLKSKR